MALTRKQAEELVAALSSAIAHGSYKRDRLGQQAINALCEASATEPDNRVSILQAAQQVLFGIENVIEMHNRQAQVYNDWLAFWLGIHATIDAVVTKMEEFDAPQ